MKLLSGPGNHSCVPIVLILILGAFPAGGCSSSVGSSDGEIEVPEGFTVEQVAGEDLVEFPMFGMVDDRGRLFLFESVGNVYDSSMAAVKEPRFRVNLLEDVDGDGRYDESTIFEDSLSFPQGGVFHDGSLIVSSAPDLIRLTDHDGDGVSDEREVLLSGWILNVNANSLIGPFESPDGWLYLTSAIMGFGIQTQEGAHLQGETARIWRVRPDGSELEWVSAGGMNNPVELTFTAEGDVIGTETYFQNPRGGLRDALVHWVKGGVYPKPNSNIDRDGLPRTGPLMPVVHKYPRVAPSGFVRYRSDQFGEEYRDNWFSARFNTHDVLRHIPSSEGASYRTEDEVFFRSDDPDFHPTDVLEAPDGSLLVVETGGWFIKGCPLSQVSKPELEGAIYRVRREGSHQTADPLGEEIDFRETPAAELASYLSDERPFVRDQAADALVRRGDEVVPALRALLREEDSTGARIRAVFALYRIGSTEAREGVRSGLEDTSSRVRVAAARSAGLAGDDSAIDRLIELVEDGEPAVRRQAATALGQIDAPEAVPALLRAAGETTDRFVEHAAIYALITIDRPGPVAEALSGQSPNVQNAALIALDQMERSTLNPDQLRGFLGSGDDRLRETALWVATHHPEWSDMVRAYLDERFSEGDFNEEERSSVQSVLTAFCGDSGVQELVSGMLESPSASTSRKLFLMDAIEECSVEEFPEAWATSLGSLLESSEEPLRLRAVDLIRMQGLTHFDDRLATIGEDESESNDLRVAALSARSGGTPSLSDAQFSYLFEQLTSSEDPSLRQEIADLLARIDLTEDQLAQLADDFLPETDSFMFIRVLDVFKQEGSAQVGGALADALLERPRALESLTEADLRSLFDGYPSSIRGSVDQLAQRLTELRAQRRARLDSLQGQLEGGDIAEGRELFFGKSTCSTCHTVGEEGGTLGPDLTSIGQVRSTHDILEAILYPSVSFVREYETYEIQTASGTQTGIVVERTPESIVLNMGPGASVRIQRDEITSMQLISQSMMPQGLDQILTTDEMADLMAFLQGQDQRPDQDEAILR